MLGVCFWEIFSFGEKPWQGVRNADVVPLLERGERLAQPAACPDDMYDLLTSMWASDPHQRPSAKEVFKQVSASMKNSPGKGASESAPNTPVLRRRRDTRPELKVQVGECRAGPGEPLQNSLRSSLSSSVLTRHSPSTSSDRLDELTDGLPVSEGARADAAAAERGPLRVGGQSAPARPHLPGRQRHPAVHAGPAQPGRGRPVPQQLRERRGGGRPAP